MALSHALTLRHRLYRFLKEWIPFPMPGFFLYFVYEILHIYLFAGVVLSMANKELWDQSLKVFYLLRDLINFFSNIHLWLCASNTEDCCTFLSSGRRLYLSNYWNAVNRSNKCRVPLIWGTKCGGRQWRPWRPTGSTWEPVQCDNGLSGPEAEEQWSEQQLTRGSVQYARWQVSVSKGPGVLWILHWSMDARAIPTQNKDLLLWGWCVSSCVLGPYVCERWYFV